MPSSYRRGADSRIRIRTYVLIMIYTVTPWVGLSVLPLGKRCVNEHLTLAPACGNEVQRNSGKVQPIVSHLFAPKMTVCHPLKHLWLDNPRVRR
jgi:hypothetical protein